MLNWWNSSEETGEDFKNCAGAPQMENKKRMGLAFVGGAFCAIVGSLIGGVVVVLIRTLQGSAKDLAEGLAFFPMAVVFVAIPGVPFGFVVGSAVGSWLLAARADHGDPGKRLYFESAGLGGVLGATFPLILTAFGWGPFNNLVTAVPISIGIGILCGAALVPFMRKRVAVPS
jgi:hypothetical protein